MQGTWAQEVAHEHALPRFAPSSSGSRRITRADLPISELDERTEQVRWEYADDDELWMLVPDEMNDPVKSMPCLDEMPQSQSPRVNCPPISLKRLWT